MKLIASFSGGKDSMLSIHRAQEMGHEIMGLITTFKGEQSWFHEIDLELLEKIADSLSLPLYTVQTSGGADYKTDFAQALKDIAAKTGIQGIVFGDIDLEDHRKWCESLAKEAGLKAVFPLWGEDRRQLVSEFLDLGYKTAIKKVDKTKLGKELLGQVLSFDSLVDFENLGIDPSGENGEYHSVVFDGPRFRQPVALVWGSIYEDDWSFIISVK